MLLIKYSSCAIGGNGRFGIRPFFVDDCILSSGILTCATVWGRADCSNGDDFF